MKPQTTPAGLAALLHPISLQDFLRQRWPGRVTHVPGSVERVRELCEDSLDNIRHDLRQIHALPQWQEVEVFDNRREGYAETVTPERAEALFRSGKASVRLRQLNGSIPVIQRWLLAILADLRSTPIRRAYTNAYLSPAGTQGNAHFDGHEVFVVQLWGRKRWRLAPCDAVPNPSQGYELGTSAHSLAELGIPPTVLPERMPPAHQDIVLQPGDLLFVPRGVLHHTQTIEDSLHLTFGLETFNLAELVLADVQQRLLSRPSWRELPVELAAATDTGRACRDTLAGLLDALASELGAQDRHGWLERLLTRAVRTAGQPQSPCYALHPRAAIEIAASPSSAATVTLRSSTGQLMPLQSSAAYLPLLRWLAEQEAPFYLDQAQAHAGDLERTTVAQLLAALVRHEVLLG